MNKKNAFFVEVQLREKMVKEAEFNDMNVWLVANISLED